MKPLSFGVNYREEKEGAEKYVSESIPDSVILTRSELEEIKKEIAGEAFDAGMQHQWERDNLLNGKNPNKQQYISSIIKIKKEG